eukprot:1107752-Pyramimonas_sp.AAC.1
MRREERSKKPQCGPTTASKTALPGPKTDHAASKTPAIASNTPHQGHPPRGYCWMGWWGHAKRE